VSDYGTAEDLKVRLDAIGPAGDRRLVPIFGSGLSNSVLPNVAEMTELFRAALPSRAVAKFDTVTDPIRGTPLAYQNGASLLRLNAGEPALTRVIRKAVLRARPTMTDAEREDASKSPAACRELTRLDGWVIPEGYRRFAQYYANLDGAVRGPILTTNFDPLIEMALEEVGLSATPVPIPTNSAPSAEQLREYQGVPVIHLHGFWTSDATLSTISQLTKDRDALSGLLRNIVDDAILLALGYSGWDDAFMRALARRLRESADLAASEVLWGAFARTREGALGEGTLQNLDGLPGFNLYLDVDGHALFDDEPSGQVEELPSPYGFSRLPTVATRASQPVESLSFLDGQHPTWQDARAGEWPLLSPAAVIKDRLEQWVVRDGGGGAIAIGPVGEGKSLALRQVALRVSEERPDWTVLWREVGAPVMTRDWLEEVVGDFTKVLICVDEADLVAPELIATKDYWGAPASGVALLLASNDRQWWRNGAAIMDRLDDVLFHGLSRLDAEQIAESWVRRGAVESIDRDASKEYAQRLYESAQAMVGDARGTLFGAVLEVRVGSKLESRIDDLLGKLKHIPIRGEGGLNLRDVFASICLMQSLFDPRGDAERGASRALISTIVSSAGDYADGPILKSLGREAAITYTGDRVYSRHPSIAHAAVKVMRERGELPAICGLVARAGGTLREVGGVDGSMYTDAYRIGRSLKNPAEALAAGVGAVEGASDLLESRVTMLSIQRGLDGAKAAKYAAALVRDLRGYKDYSATARGYYTEFSVISRDQGEAYVAVGLAALALADGVGYHLDAKRAGYALTSLGRSAHIVAGQRASLVGALPALTYVCMERVTSRAEASRFLGREGSYVGDVNEIRKLSADALIRRMTPLLSAAISSVEKVHQRLPIPPTRSFDDLRRLVKPSEF